MTSTSEAITAERRRADHALFRFVQRQRSLSVADRYRWEELAAKDGLTAQEVLEREAVIAEPELAQLLAETLRLPLVDLTTFSLDPAVTAALKETLATKYQVIPLRLDDGHVEVATANPLDLDAMHALEFALGRRVQAAVTTRAQIRHALSHSYRLEESLEQFLDSVPAVEPLAVMEIRDSEDDLYSVQRDAELAPIVRLAEMVMAEGIRSGASDIHLEPCIDGVAVRYRLDGMLEERFRLPKWVQSPLIVRFKILARLDITERRAPQDGRIQARHADRTVDMRLSSLPAQHGEKITLRILDATRGLKTVDKLGFSDADLHRVRDRIGRPEGMILVTGPTGSGKSTTLYAFLREIMSPRMNVVTIENPIEYQIKGITQVEVHARQGLTFASVLRSILRQDPDVILIGEIRDHETAQIAFQAAQTGHLVLSSLHTNDAAATVTRLVDLGIEPYLLSSSLQLVVAQRLVRQVCTQCAAPHAASPDARRLLRLTDERPIFRRGAGCTACRQTGYAGRLGVYEVLPMSAAIGHLIEARSGEVAIRQQARLEGCSTLFDDALAKLAAGMTTPDEIIRVVQVNDPGTICPACAESGEELAAPCPHRSGVVPTTCRNCGQTLQPGWVNCPECGNPKHAAPATATPMPVTTVPSSSAPSNAPILPSSGRDARSGFKVLVVDDDADLRRIVRLTLERCDLNITVISAQDGIEALALVHLEPPDLVVLDVAMPGLDGFEVCRRLRAEPATAKMPVLMLTAKESTASVTRGFEAGADDYVVKPFRRDDLLARIRRMLERTYRVTIASAAAEEAAPAATAAPAAPASPL